MGRMSTKCARLCQWWSFRGPEHRVARQTHGAQLCCASVGLLELARLHWVLGAAYLRRAQLGVRDAGSMRGTSRCDVRGGEGLGCFGSVVI